MASSTVNWSNIVAHLDGPSHIPLQLKLKVADVQITLSQAGQERHLHITLAQLLGPEPGNEEAHGKVNYGLKEGLRLVFGAETPQFYETLSVWSGQRPMLETFLLTQLLPHAQNLSQHQHRHHWQLQGPRRSPSHLTSKPSCRSRRSCWRDS